MLPLGTKYTGIISDNLKTCIRCFELSDGASMMNIPSEAGTGTLELKVAHVPRPSG